MDSRAYFNPVDEAGDLLPHRFGFLSCHHVVVLRQHEPVHHNDVSGALPLVQRRHQLRHPALEHAAQLSTTFQIRVQTYQHTATALIPDLLQCVHSCQQKGVFSICAQLSPCVCVGQAGRNRRKILHSPSIRGSPERFWRCS